MENMEKISKMPPPHGWVGTLAKLAGCSRPTVLNAIRKNRQTEVCKRVRRLYEMKYGTISG
jgi:hypothetical protein